jgi:hypothetical protein
MFNFFLLVLNDFFVCNTLVSLFTEILLNFSLLFISGEAVELQFLDPLHLALLHLGNEVVLYLVHPQCPLVVGSLQLLLQFGGLLLVAQLGLFVLVLQDH